MAFPTSSLTNNQVHKEGNRAWVYDSTLGVWDQVRENNTDVSYQRGEIQNGTTLDNVTFPAGHVIQMASAVGLTNYSSTVSYNSTGLAPLAQLSITPKVTNSHFLISHAALFGRSAAGRNQWLISKAFTPGTSAYGDTSNRIYYEHYADYATVGFILQRTKQWLHTTRNATAGTEITYYLFGGVIEAATMECWGQQLIIWEIQP